MLTQEAFPRLITGNIGTLKWKVVTSLYCDAIYKRGRTVGIGGGGVPYGTKHGMKPALIKYGNRRSFSVCLRKRFVRGKARNIVAYMTRSKLFFTTYSASGLGLVLISKQKCASLACRRRSRVCSWEPAL